MFVYSQRGHCEYLIMLNDTLTITVAQCLVNVDLSCLVPFD